MIFSYWLDMNEWKADGKGGNMGVSTLIHRVSVCENDIRLAVEVSQRLPNLIGWHKA